MKRTGLFLVLFIAGLSVFAQDGIIWTVAHNKKKIFSATEENEQKNIITVNAADFKPGNSLIISYSGINTDVNGNKWIRTIGIYNEADKELYRKNTRVAKLKDEWIKKMLQENRKIKIYTWALPKDPKEAARVRIRRVHLCTIELK
jgi:hypothetical protein